MNSADLDNYITGNWGEDSIEDGNQDDNTAMTIDDAKTLRYGERLHYTGRHDCTRTVGPRGGIKDSITEVRVSGAVKTWKRDASRIHVPVKYGLYESAYLTEDNLQDFHRAVDCPLAN